MAAKLKRFLYMSYDCVSVDSVHLHFDLCDVMSFSVIHKQQLKELSYYIDQSALIGEILAINIGCISSV